MLELHNLDDYFLLRTCELSRQREARVPARALCSDDVLDDNYDCCQINCTNKRENNVTKVMEPGVGNRRHGVDLQERPCHIEI